jgi:glc operon protein GlcG
MKAIRFSFLTVAALFFLSSAVFPQDEGHLPKAPARAMTLEKAKRIVAAAHEAACKVPATCSGALAVVDDAGVLVYEETIDGSMADTPDLAIKKAKTSALWRRPTQFFHDSVKSQRNMSYAGGTFLDMTTSHGGVPLVVNDTIVGGFGSGGTLAGPKLVSDAAEAECAKIFGAK